MGLMIKEYLNQPYPLFESKWKLNISISLFVALFMLIFQPFGLSDYHSINKPIIIAGYGCVTYVVLLFNLHIIPFFLKSLFDGKLWTVIKQIFWLIWIIFTIGFGNYIYSSFIFSIFSGFYGFLIFQFFTLAIGIIPIVVLTILKQNFMLSQNLKTANDFNNRLKLKDEKVMQEQIICLMAENGKDKLEIGLSNLLYIESTGNYIQIFYTKEFKLKNALLRSSLKRTELQIKDYSSIVKCHRAFLVSINKITQVKGNSQGLKLVLKDTDIEIPVSRNFSKSLKDKIISCR